MIEGSGPEPDPDPDPYLGLVYLDSGSGRPKNTWIRIRNTGLNLKSLTPSPKEVTKQKESRFFLLFLLDDRRIRAGAGS
jgi:hypothetical protein